MSEKLGSAILELATDDSKFTSGVDKAEGRAMALGKTLDMTSGSALELADKLTTAGQSGDKSAAAWLRAGTAIDALAAAQVTAKAQVDNARAALNAGTMSMEAYNREVIQSKVALGQMEDAHRKAQTELRQSITAMGGVTTASGQQRQGLQQLSYQLGDVSTMYALGMRPAQIFSSQIGQVGQAVQMMAGEGSKLARFLMGPWGMAVSAGVMVLGPLIGKLLETADAADAATDALERLNKKRTDGITERRTIIDAEKALNDLLKEREKIYKGTGNSGFGAVARFGEVGRDDRETTAKLAEINKRIGEARADIDYGRVSKALGDDAANDPMAILKGGTQAERKKREAKGRKGPKGKSEAEIEFEFLGKLDQLNQEELQARLQMATSASERADISYQMLADQRTQREAEINANKDYSEAQKKALIAQLDVLYGRRSADGSILVSGGLLKTRIAREQSEAEKRQDDDMLARKQAALEAWARVATTSAERARLEEAALELAQEIERNLLEQQIASGQIADAEKARAALTSKQGAEREGARQGNAGPLGQYVAGLQRNKAETGDRVEELMVQELDWVHQSITNSISDRLGVKDPFLKGLIDMFVEDVLIRPFAEALQSAQSKSGGGGGGGFFGKLFGSLLGGIGGASPQASLSASASETINDPQFAGLFASGGTIPDGSWGIVGEEGPEPVFATSGGVGVLPNSAMRSMGGGGSGKPGKLEVTISGARGNAEIEAMVRQGVSQGLSAYDAVVSSRVKDNLERRG